MPKKRSKDLNVGRNMPPRYHKLPDQEYEVGKSKAIQWLIQQPSIQEFVWSKFKQSGDIFFDPITKKWQGVDYDA